jgi:hypothetical protein
MERIKHTYDFDKENHYVHHFKSQIKFDNGCIGLAP